MTKSSLLLSVALGLFVCVGYAQSLLANDRTSSVKPEEPKEEQVHSHNSLVQEVSEKHIFARLKADKFITRHKFGLARYEVRQAQQMLAIHRQEIPASIYAFLDTLGQAKLAAIDGQELVYLRKREMEKYRAKHMAKYGAKHPVQVPAAPQERPLQSPTETAKLPISPTLKPPTAALLPPAMLQPAKRGVRTLLRKVAYEDVSLSDVLDDLRERTGSNIVVNWQSLENIGIDKTATVNLDLMNVRAERVLKSVLDNFSTGWGYGRASYVVHEGVVTIASSEDLGKIVDTWVLDITHLMRATKDKRGGSLFESVGGGHGDRGRGRTGTRTRSGSEADTTEDRDELKERMIELVRSAALTESWREGGGPGAVSIYGTRLIVTQSITNLQKIAQTLAILGW